MASLPNQPETLAQDAAQAVEDAAQAALADLHNQALHAAAVEFSRQTGITFGLGLWEVYTCLLDAPNNMLWMLETSDGWQTLAAYVAAMLGVEDGDYTPTVH